MKVKIISSVFLISVQLVALPLAQQTTDWKSKVECELFDDVQWKEDY